MQFIILKASLLPLFSTLFFFKEKETENQKDLLTNTQKDAIMQIKLNFISSVFLLPYLTHNLNFFIKNCFREHKKKVTKLRC
jgi:hypothetical protein